MNGLKVNFNALKKNSWSSEELANVKLVSDFIQNLMNDHKFDYVKQTFGNDAYVQHNRNIHDGIDGVIATVKQLATRFPDYTYDVKHMYADGEYVTFHSHATVRKQHRGNDKKGFNIVDTWKIKDGKIVEHWDAIQPIDWYMRFYMWLSGGAIRNSNGSFSRSVAAAPRSASRQPACRRSGF